MLFLLIVLSLISLAYGQVDGRPSVQMPSSYKDAVRKVTSECVKETGVAQEIVDSYYKITFTPSNDMKSFMYCILRKTKKVNDEGHLDKNVLELYGDSDRLDEVQKVLEECNSIKRETVIDTLFETVSCFYKKTPVLALL